MTNKNIDINWNRKIEENKMFAITAGTEIEIKDKVGWLGHATSIYNSLQEVEESSIKYLIECIWSIYINEKQFLYVGMVAVRATLIILRKI